jgi:glycosyltransferase involved in cell wall biosynthesis
MVWAECRRRGIRHLHAHLANVGADVAWSTAALGNAIDGPDTWWWSFTMHGCLEFWGVSRFNLVAKVRAAGLVVCISEFTRAQLMALCPPDDWEKLVVVHTGVDLTRYVPRATARDGDDCVTLLAVGRLSAEKGHLVLLDALAALHRRGVPVHLVMVGDGPMRAQLEHHADARGVRALVTFAGAVGQDEMPEQFSRADVFVQPSFMEGIPVVLMEAMAAGLPVVSSGVAGIPELVADGHTGLLVPPGRADLLADAVERLAGDADARRRMGCAARAAVEHGFDADAGARAVARHFATRAARGA